MCRAFARIRSSRALPARRHTASVVSPLFGNRLATAYTRVPPQQFQEQLALPPEMEIEPQPSGTFAVDSYTVCHDRSGEVEFSILCGRTADGRRAWAQTPPEEKDVLIAMTREEWIGREGKIASRSGDVNIVEF